MLLQIVIVAAGSLLAMVYMTLSAVGPGVYLALVSPFDALFSGVFGIFGNGVTYLPLIAMLATTSPSQWVQQFFGTRIQLFFFIFLLMLSISHMLTISVSPEAAAVEYIRKLTIFMIVSIWAWYMRSPEQLLSVNRALVLSTAAYTLISMADFYFGIGALPGAEPSLGGIVGETLEETSSVHSLRYRGGGLPINRTANWLIVPAFVGFGWFMVSKRGAGKILALAATIVCVTGIFATVGRSAIIGTVVGFVLLLPTAVGMRPTRIVGAVVAVVLIGGIGLAAMSYLGFLDVLEARFVGDRSVGAATDRLGVYAAAIRIWMTSPVIGIGDSVMSYHELYVGVTAHNTFLGLLVEAGVVGFIPYVGLTILFLIRFFRKNPLVDPEFDAWRPYFLAGYVGSMVQNMFNEYTWERFIWYTIAYLIAHERLEMMARAAAAQKAFQEANAGNAFHDPTVGSPAF